MIRPGASSSASSNPVLRYAQRAAFSGSQTIFPAQALFSLSLNDDVGDHGMPGRQTRSQKGCKEGVFGCRGGSDRSIGLDRVVVASSPCIVGLASSSQSQRSSNCVGLGITVRRIESKVDLTPEYRAFDASPPLSLMDGEK